MKVREPVARPLDVVAIELLLSASQAFLVGVLMYLAVGIWDDRGVGSGPVAGILALLALAVGGAWLYWLAGGVGWPMAAANTPAAMFLGFALMLGVVGDQLVRVEGVPTLLAVLAAVYGVVGGVFIDSPRRWRWDQRQKLRPGTEVPTISEKTRAVAAAVPRSLPRREPLPEPGSDLAARIEAATPPGSKSSTADTSIPYLHADDDDGPVGAATGDGASDEPDEAESETIDELTTPVAGQAEEPAGSGGPTMPTARLAGIEAGRDEEDDEEAGIELPTAIEPRAQRSPWAWAAPPAWNRDEDDEAVRTSSSKRS